MYPHLQVHEIIRIAGSGEQIHQPGFGCVFGWVFCFFCFFFKPWAKSSGLCCRGAFEQQSIAKPLTPNHEDLPGWGLCVSVASFLLVKERRNPGQVTAAQLQSPRVTLLWGPSYCTQPVCNPSLSLPKHLGALLVSQASRNSCKIAVSSPFWDWEEEGGLEQYSSLVVASWGGAGFNNVPEYVAVLGHV